MNAVAPRVLAFYLPQFHPIPENDAWWGTGFTEWTNVRRARPLFKDHAQPDLPGELGYYDLRSAATRKAQADLARAHGITGFCYYHYWFNGRRLLGRVIDDVLAEREPDFPFCLCWANESWTRAWDGLEHDVLMRQTYDPEDDRRHIRWLAGVFEDPRYIRVDGRPLLLVYRTSKLPSAAMTAARWREEARRLGVGEIYLCSVESLPADRLDPTRTGFDAAVEFQPDWNEIGALTPVADGDFRVFDYDALVKRAVAKPPASYLRYPCVTPGWDNSPRRQKGATIVSGSTPDSYGRWLEAAIDRMIVPSAEENFVFVNAWNEWGEGAHLEPSSRWGRAYLETTRDVVDRSTVKVWTPTNTRAVSRSPRVTVGFPTCNGAAHLEMAIQSILGQTFDDFELLVMDDCSSDGTLDIARRFEDPRIRIEQNPVRQGLVKNWNRCLEAARGEYVSVFHQDDWMAPDNLARKVSVLDANPSVAFVHSNVRQIAENGTVISDYWSHPPTESDSGVHPGRTFFERLFWGDNIVCCPSVVLRRRAVAEHGGFDPQLPFTADWEMWMRLCLFHDVAFIPEALVSYRRHAAAETERFSGARGIEQHFMAKHRILVKFEDRLPVSDWLVRLAHRYETDAIGEAKEALLQARPHEARDLIALAASVRASVPGHEQEDLAWSTDLVATLLNGSVPTVRREELVFQNEELAAQVRAFKASHSWRVTAPLRWMFRVLTGRSA